MWPLRKKPLPPPPLEFLPAESAAVMRILGALGRQTSVLDAIRQTRTECWSFILSGLAPPKGLGKSDRKAW